MKDLAVLVLAVIGGALLAGGNDLGILGLVPAIAHQLNEMKKDGADSPEF